MHVQDDNKIGKKKLLRSSSKFQDFKCKGTKSLICFGAELKESPTKYNYQEI
jgi:hypothetical protein